MKMPSNFEEDWFDNVKTNSETKGAKKVWEYVERMLESDRFNKALLQLRKKFEIPSDGFLIHKEASQWLDYNSERVSDLKRDLEEMARRKSTQISKAYFSRGSFVF